MNRLKSIYLDWNIFQDLIQNRKESRLEENLNAGKIKGYSIPYSHAHISDLLRCSICIFLFLQLDGAEQR